MAMSKEDIVEYVRCKSDIYYFLENYFMIQNPDADGGVSAFIPFEFQREIIDSVLGGVTNPKTNKPFKRVIARIPRQLGKTTVATGILLWKVTFGDDVEKVLCVSREQKQATDILDRVKFALEQLPTWMMKGIKKYNETSVQFEDGSYIYCRSTTPNSGRGLSPNFLYIDEFAFVPERITDAFLASVMPAVSRNPKSIVLITSTPHGLNQFFDFWQGAVRQKNGYHPITSEWDAVAGRDEDFKKDVIATFGRKHWEQEYLCSFLGSANTLVNTNILEQMDSEDPSEFRFDELLHIFEKPQAVNSNMLYVAGIDTAMGVGKDSSIVQVIKIWKDVIDGVENIHYKQVAVFRDADTAPTQFAEICFEICKYYNNAVAMIETNDIGGNVATLLWHKYEYENMVHIGRKEDIGIRSTVQLKQSACLHAKEVIENNFEGIIHKETIHELGVFEEVRSGVFKASGNKHDDTVMGLIWALYLTATDEFEDFGFALPEIAKVGAYSLGEEPYNPETDDFF